jgi:hypothetical protein
LIKIRVHSLAKSAQVFIRARVTLPKLTLADLTLADLALAALALDPLLNFSQKKIANVNWQPY